MKHSAGATSLVSLWIGMVPAHPALAATLWTEDAENGAAFVTGAVYEDLNGNSFYDISEGRSGVRIDVEGSVFFATSSSSGGYTVPVSSDGIYDVTFSGGGYATFNSTADVLNRANVKVDYLVISGGLLGDLDCDSDVDFDDIGAFVLGLTDPEAYENQYGVPATTKGDIDGDNDLDFDDIPGLVNLLAGGAQTVLEPSAMAMVATALLSVLVHTRLRRLAV